jgi:hypothetical protein
MFKNMRAVILISFMLFFQYSMKAQQDSIAVEEEIDFSQFETMDMAGDAKRYCTSKVFGLSPNKLISISYDFQGAHIATNVDPYKLGGPSAITNDNMIINSSGGLRLVANVPLVSNTKWLVNIGGNYWRNGYDAGFTEINAPKSYVLENFASRGLTTIGLNATVFKPLNKRNFILSFVSADANGNYNLSDAKIGEYLTAPKITVAAFYGWKRTDLSMIAVGVSRTYRPGALGIIPLILFNHTFENRRWGVESLFPARLAFRRSFNTRNLLLLGYELEGNSYSIINRTTGSANFNPAYNNLELRRSEIRPRVTYEKALTDFIWISVQLGYRINYNFNIDQGDTFRLIGSDTPYYMDNTLTNTWYFQVGINLVSP